jgi:hypothetical protein
MNRIATLVLVLASLSGSALCQYSAEFSSYYSGKRYDFRITSEQLERTPAWLDSEANPPLSARNKTRTKGQSRANQFGRSSSFTFSKINCIRTSSSVV